jgi:hypothetical protein
MYKYYASLLSAQLAALLCAQSAATTMIIVKGIVAGMTIVTTPLTGTAIAVIVPAVI